MEVAELYFKVNNCTAAVCGRLFVDPGSQFVLHGDEARKDAKPFARVEA